MNGDRNPPITASGLRPLRPLLVLLALQLVVSLAFIIGFCYAFKFSKWLIAVHIPLAAALYTCSLIAPGLLLFSSAIRRRAWTRYLFGLVPGICFAGLATLYVVDLASYRWLGALLNYRYLRTWLLNLMSGRNLIPLSGRTYAVLAVIIIVVLGIFVVFAPKIFRGIEALLLPENRLSLFHNRARTRKSIAALAVLLFAHAGYVYYLRREAPYSELLSGDPIISFARSTLGVFDRNRPAFVEKLRQDEQRCREQYRFPDTFDSKNVIIIVVDSWRPDHLSVYGYGRSTTPFLDSLSKTGKLRRVNFATASCPETTCGVLSTLNSKTLRYQIPGNVKLQELLAGRGYDTFFILSGDHNMGDLRENYGSGMSLLFDGNNSKRYDLNDDQLIFEGLEAVPPQERKPAFFLFHLMSPHLLGIKREEFRVYSPSHVPNDGSFFLGSDLDRETLINNYDNGTLQADATIKRIFEVLEQKKYLQNSMVVILGDHGESLGERGKYGHIAYVYQEYIRIPLLIYDPSPTRYANLDFATQIDIAPTIVDRLKLPAPACWEGASLLSSGPKSFSIHQTPRRPPCFAIISRTERAMFKYILCSAGKAEQLYDLTQDPNEQTNLISSADPALIDSLRAQLQRSQSR